MARGIVPLVGEEVLIVVHKSWLSLWKQGLKSLLILVFACGALYFGLNEYMLLTAIFLFVLLFGYLLVVFIVWFYDIYIITNKRVLITSQKGIFHKERSEIDSRDILEVRSVRKGLVETVFGFGSVVLVQRGGKEIELRQVSDPDYISQSIHTLASTSVRR